ncbi:pyridoxal phosphate-dependent decarboxylase family protein [Streptomyces sp. NPDC002536]
MPAPAADHSPAALAGGAQGTRALRPLVDTALHALARGATARGGPLPAGGPPAVDARITAAATPVLPEHGTGPHEALRTLVQALAEGAADPADPHCAAHLHGPALAVAAAADLAACALNPSLDSWDQAPSATALEALTTRALAALAYPRRPAPDALVTTGGTESNQLALLLARENARTCAHRPLHVVCGANAHHSIPRAAWLLGLPAPHTLPTPTGTLDPTDLDKALGEHHTDAPRLVVATAGTTDAGLIDPLPRIADVCAARGVPFHIDASYGGPLLFSDTLRPALAGLDRADSISLDLHKLGWQPIAAGLLAVPGTEALAPLGHQADYLNAHDDIAAGHPDLLHRSLRTTRRPDILKIAVTLRALGRTGLGELIERVCTLAHRLADLIDAHPSFVLHSRPTLSTVLFRPANSDDRTTGSLRRRLLHHGHAVLGRATTPEGLWLKATLLNPHTRTDDLRNLLELVEGHTTG